jgi:hemerythrin-like domain-containing protein
MGIQIGAKPDSGFDDPIGMLKDCHRRIEQFLNILCVVVSRAQGRALSDEEGAAVKSAIEYFRSGGQRHTSDEEESLFPRLRNQSDPGAVGELTGLESDHQRANDLHAEVEKLYLAWIARTRLSREDEQRLLGATEELGHIYEGHIKIEEQAVFPLALKLLDNQSIAAMGQEFRARRLK